MKYKAFAILDVLMAMVIMGIGGIALLQLAASGTKANGSAAAVTTAAYLADDVHEFALTLECTQPTLSTPVSFGLTDPQFTNVCYLDQKTFDPIDATGVTLVNSSGRKLYPNYSISCRVYSYNNTAPGTQTAATGTNFRRLYVTVSYQNQPVLKNTWIIAPSK